VTDKKTKEFSEQETRQRFVAALKGARLAGHVPMKAKEKPKVKVAKKTRPPKKNDP
jgi:hypothetical protein